MKLKKKIKIIGLGSGGHARVLLDILKKDKRYLFMGLLDKKKNNFSNIPILGTDKDLSKIYNQGIKNCFIGFSDIKNTSINLSIFNKTVLILEKIVSYLMNNWLKNGSTGRTFSRCVE